MTDNIHTAIMAVYNAVGFVQKERSKEGGVPYAYAGEAALIEALRPALVEAGIYMSVLSVKDVVRDVYETSRGAAMNRTCITVTVRFTHAASETYIDVESVGEGADVGDKSAPKALTGAFKYALRQTFCIETGDDPDHSASAPRTQALRPGNPPHVPIDLEASEKQKGMIHALLAKYTESVGGKEQVREMADAQKIPLGLAPVLRKDEDGWAFHVSGIDKKQASQVIECLKGMGIE